MRYELTVNAAAPSALSNAIADIENWFAADASLHLVVSDQASLVAVMNRLHDLGVDIGAVTPIHDAPSHPPASQR